MKNLVILIGNLGKDPELKKLESGNSVCTAPLATSETYNNKQTGEKVTNTTWHNLEIWGKGAEIFDKYLSKGSKVYIEGSIKVDTYEKDGVTKYLNKINVRDFKFLDTKESVNIDNQPQGNVNANPTNQNEDEDDLPF